MSDEPSPRPADEEMNLAESSRAMVGMLTRAPTVESLLELICECARVDRAADSGDADTPHLWLCPAGSVEFWLSRHRAETIAWLDRLESLESLPPEPTW